LQRAAVIPDYRRCIGAHATPERLSPNPFVFGMTWGGSTHYTAR
jgi:hypothetical protein